MISCRCISSKSSYLLKLRFGSLERAWRAAENDYVSGAGLRKGGGNAEADAAASARDEDDFAAGGVLG